MLFGASCTQSNGSPKTDSIAMEVASDQHTTLRNCISSALLCIVIAGIICELGMLLVTCIAQFEPLFSTAEAFGGLLLASIPLVIVSIIALIDLIAVSRQLRICRIVLIYGWLGYAAGVALGMVTHEVRRATVTQKVRGDQGQ